MGWPQLIPLTIKSDTGHKNGVGKKIAECVGISIKICKAQANIGRNGLCRKTQIKPNTNANIKRL